MSTLSVDTLEDKSAAQTVDMADVVHGTAKVWGNANFAASVGASYNITSVTDTGTGIVTWNITNAFSTVNFGTVAMTESASTIRITRIQAVTASSIRTDSSDTTTLLDATEMHTAAYGTLA